MLVELKEIMKQNLYNTLLLKTILQSIVPQDDIAEIYNQVDEIYSNLEKKLDEIK